MELLVIILLPLLGACLPPLCERFGRNVCAVSAATGPLLALAFFSITWIGCQHWGWI
jgi:multicomponent K+:H+ antiporter subunit A